MPDARINLDFFTRTGERVPVAVAAEAQMARTTTVSQLSKPRPTLKGQGRRASRNRHCGRYSAVRLRVPREWPAAGDHAAY